MASQRLLLDDGFIAVSDVRCIDAPQQSGPEERAPVSTLVVPLAGIFLRQVRRPGSRATPREVIGDCSRALAFHPDEVYRVAHPAGGHDRCVAFALREPLFGRLDSDRPVPPSVQRSTRRLCRALAADVIDPLEGGETALAIVRSIMNSEMLERPARAPRRDVVPRVRFALAGRLGERISLAELGRQVGLSGWELARRFRRQTGTSIHQYRSRLRIEAALERIEAGERDLTQLALDLGFADHSHMTNAIRRATGRPPSAYRADPSADELLEMRTNLQA